MSAILDKHDCDKQTIKDGNCILVYFRQPSSGIEDRNWYLDVNDEYHVGPVFFCPYCGKKLEVAK